MTLIEDGKGRGRQVAVDFRNRIETSSLTKAFQHVVSHQDGLTYQFIGDAAEFNGTASVLWIENTSSTKDLVVSYIRVQLVGTDATAVSATSSKFFRLNKDSSSRSGGATITPINMNFKSGLTADANAFSGNTAMTSTAGSEFDRWYPNSSGMMTFNKEGSLILGKGDVLEVAFTSNEAQGATAYARVTGFYLDPEE